MAVRLFALGIRPNLKKLIPLGSAGNHDLVRTRIGNREVVGFGVNGQPEYKDRPDFPFPSIRWRETDCEFAALKEKEKGDWKKLTIEEKKELYRSSFCQTFAEFQAPNGEWKSIIACSLVLMTMGVWLFITIKFVVLDQTPLPASFEEEHRRRQFRRLLDMRNQSITGISAQWDYEKDDWKRK